jgi:hypothetical protein
MTLLESSKLMDDPVLRNRIKAAALKYADVILNRPVETPGINGQRTWAKNCQQMPDTIAQSLQPVVVEDSAVQDAGTLVTDEALQAAVETAVNKQF